MSLALLAQAIYGFSATVLALYGFNMLVLTVLFLCSRQSRSCPRPPRDWPYVTVQLPLFNECLVVERLIDAVAELEYPSQLLSIQVLDDSTDETTLLARRRVEHYQALGIDITCLHRSHRTGNKAGALASGLASATGELIAVFDADFVPPPNFLQQVVPHFSSSRVGMVQARWDHLNETSSLLTRAQALALDGHMVVEQMARSANGLLFNFNGSAGVWRRECIESCGGWQADTLSEDLDLSYRAQLRGWKFHYLSDVVVPAEIPLGLLAYKQQQFRWVKGSVQCLLKHSPGLVRSRFSLWKRAQGLLHLGGYLMHPMMLCLLLGSLPMMLLDGANNNMPSLLGLAGLGPPVLYTVSQISAYPRGVKRSFRFLALLLLGVGVALNNTRAVLEAVVGHRPSEFLRTPKTDAERDSPGGRDYALSTDWSTWVEFALAGYAVAAATIALQKLPGLAPFLLVFALGFLYVSVLGFFESRRTEQAARSPLRAADLVVPRPLRTRR